jgi:hypothetical protein
MHESAHASALLIAGWAPLLVRTDQPPGYDGQVVVNWDVDVTADKMHTLLISILCGVLSDATEWLELKAFPLDADEWAPALRSDVEQAASICAWLDLDTVGWHRAVFDARALTKQPRYRRLWWELARRLEDVELVVQGELLELAEATR